eukprot:4643419-Ditylum_brightwellii.AAC.3
MLTLHYFEHSTNTNYMCNVPGYGSSRFHKKGAVNILSLSKVKDKYRVTYDSEDGNKFTIHEPGYNIDFVESPNGLYYHDVSDKSVCFHISTVEGNKQMIMR